MTTKGDTSLNCLTEDDIKQAFEKTYSKFEKVQGIRLVRIAEEYYYSKAIQFCREHFVPNEIMFKSVGTPWCEEIETFLLAVLKCNLSLMFIEEETDEVVAFRTIRYVNKNEKYDNKESTPEPLKVILQFCTYCEGRSSFFDRYGIQQAVHFHALGVSGKYQRRGFATKIFHAAIDMVRNLGLDQVYIKGEGSSNFSQKIYENEGFDILYEHTYDHWEVDGRKPIINTGEHKSLKLYGLKITQN